MNLHKISDVYIKKGERIDVPSGVPTDLNYLDFKEQIENNREKLVVPGRLNYQGGQYLGIKVNVPRSINVHSSKEPLELVGTVKEGNDFVAYYRPQSGWNLSSKE